MSPIRRLLLQLILAITLVVSGTAGAETVQRELTKLQPAKVVETTAEAGGTLTIMGAGFVDGVSVDIGPHHVHSGALKISEQVIGLELPMGIAAGLYAVRVRWPDGVVLCAADPLVVKERPCSLEDVPFEKGRSELTREAAFAIVRNLACLARAKATTYTVLGFASRDGQDSQNTVLSKARAEVVAKFVRTHLPQTETMTVGLGNSLPVQLGENEVEYARNRRATILQTGDAPCQPVRIPVADDGTPEIAGRALLTAAAQCFLRRGVTKVLVVVPEEIETDPDRPMRATRLAGVLRTILGGNAPPGLAVPLVQPIYATPQEAGELRRVFRLGALEAKSGQLAEVFPIAWYYESDGFLDLAAWRPECVSRYRPGQKGEEPVAEIGSVPLPIVSLTLFSMSGMNRRHLGPTAEVTVSLASISESLLLSISPRASFYSPNFAYYFDREATEERVSNLYLLGFALGLEMRFDALRLFPNIGAQMLLDPLAGGSFFTGDFSVGWSPNGTIEFLVRAGGGISVWSSSEKFGYWQAGFGLGWRFE